MDWGVAGRWRLHVHGWFHLDRRLRGYLCVRAVVSVWVVEVGELTRGKSGRSACRCEEVEVLADFRRYWGSVRSPCPRAERMVGRATKVPARGMRRYTLVGVGGLCLGRCWSGRGAGNNDAGTCMTWLVSARMDVTGRPWAFARSADSVSCRCSVSSIRTRLVSGSTLRRTRKGRGIRISGAGRSGWGCVICWRSEGWRSSIRYA